METIIPPVDKSMLLADLKDDFFVRDTNNGHNKIYVFKGKDAPNLMREIGRLREITFREAGGGTGKACDIDKFDEEEDTFKQLIVWHPDNDEIVGGYRVAEGRKLEVREDGTVVSPTARLFNFSEKFIKEYLPVTIELGRSFVQPNYQPHFDLRKGMYSLDNLWDGLGAIVIDHPDVQYLFGKVTMYSHYDQLARDMVLYFLKKHFPDPDGLMMPYEELKINTSRKILDNIFTGYNYQEDYKILVQKVRSLHENIPPLVNAYMNLSSTMRTFGTALNEYFGNVEETGIMVTIKDIYDFKKDRHIATYKK
jgi:hypothetical protein